jgi:arylsulfatase A-like enzyme
LAVDKTVEHVDIFQTIADLVGGESVDKAKPAQGTSVLPLILKDHREFPIKPTFSQTIIEARPKEKEGSGNAKYMDKYALQYKSHKYIYIPEGEDGFYALHKDPREVKNLANSNG